MVEIHPLKLGTHEVQSFRFICLPEREYLIPTSFNAFLVKDDGKNIIVDTGPGSVDTPKNKKHRAGIKQTADQRMDTLLKDRFKLEPDDIDVVIITHLHWDHNGDNKLFSNAEFILQEKEREYAKKPAPLFEKVFDITPDFPPVYGDTKFKLINGDYEITKNVSVTMLPGHSPGLQGVVIDAGGKIVVLSQDLFPMYYNLENRNTAGIYNNIDEWYLSAEKVEEIADIIVPGHDPAVFEKFKGFSQG